MCLYILSYNNTKYYLLAANVAWFSVFFCAKTNCLPVVEFFFEAGYKCLNVCLVLVYLAQQAIDLWPLNKYPTHPFVQIQTQIYKPLYILCWWYKRKLKNWNLHTLWKIWNEWAIGHLAFYFCFFFVATTTNNMK